MIFDKILAEKHKMMSPLFDQIFDLVLKNQTHSGDLLLVMENGWLTREKDHDNNGEIKNFFNLGVGVEGHCESTNHEFISSYIKEAPLVSYEHYLEFIKYDPDRREEIEELKSGEAHTIQIEMLIYLKIWEGETFLKRWYQLSRLMVGKDYDWHFSIGTNNRGPFGSLPRYKVISEIKDNLLIAVPELYNIWVQTQKSQLRNAIAHSQYAILDRDIILNNFQEGKGGSLGGISFDGWIEFFHNSLVMFNLLQKLFNRIRNHYYQKSLRFNKKAEIRINRLHPDPNQSFVVVHTRDFFMDWAPQPE